MSAESDLYTALSGAAAVTAIVGTRIYPDARPQESETPAIVYQRSGTEPVIGIHGAAPFAVLANFEISSVDETRNGAELLADAVVVALSTSDFLYADRASNYVEQVDLFVTTVSFNRYD